jgi:RNA polymerase sigma factor (sigma-70 family)
MPSLDELMRAARSGDSGSLNTLRELNRNRPLPDHRATQLASLEKEAAQAEKASQRAMAAAEREQSKANRNAKEDYKGDAIAFFTRNGRVIPITAPSGAAMRKWGKSGTMFDPVTGKAYIRDDKGKLIEQDPEKDGKTIKKDGHVYKAVDGMKWKWVGYDKDKKTSGDRRFDSELAGKTRALKEQMQEATGELTLLNKDIASDRARIRDLDKQINDADKLSGDPAKVSLLQGQKEKLEGALSAKVERQAQSELDAYRTRAEVKSGMESIEAERKAYYDNKSQFNFDETKFPNTDRRPEATGGQSNYLSEFAADLVAGTLGVRRSEPIQPIGPGIMESVLARVDANNKILGDNAVANANAFADAATRATASPQANQWNAGTMQNRSQQATAQLSAEAPIKLPESVRKATGVDYAPPSWFTQEAMERQLTAKLAGQDVIEAPPGYKLEGGTLYALKDTSSTFWGVPLPWSKQKTPEAIGKFKFDQHGVGYVELDPLAQQSPSFASGNYYRGMPEYTGMPKWFEDSAKPKMGSQVVAEVRKEVEAMDWQKAAGEMWDSRRWSPEKTRDTLDKWQTANDRQRADIIAELDPRQKALAPQDRRLDPQWLYQQGQLSAQDARLLNNAAYGTNPDFAALPSAFEQWAKNSPSEAARDYRKQQAALPKLSLWQSALTHVVNRLPGAQVATILGMINSSERSRIGSANTYAARDAFMTQYYQETARKTDFNMPAFVAARDKMLGDESLAGWAGNALNNTLQNALGSSAGVMLGAGKLLADTVTNSILGYRLVSDEERTLIGAQTQISWDNMVRAAKDRVPSSLGEALMMTQPSSYLWNLGGVRDKAWSGEKGGNLNSAVNDLYAYINSGRTDERELQRLSEKVRATSEAFHEGSGTRMSYENDPLDPRSTMNKSMAAYMETMSPAYWSTFKSGALNSQYELEIQKMATDYASSNGAISESSFFGPMRQGFKGGQVAPLTEMGIELASNLVGIGAAKMIVAGKWLATSQRAGLALNRTGRVVNSLEGMQERFFTLGKVQRTPGTVLTAGQQLRNTAVDMSKMAWASGSGEMFEEVVASFGEAGATLGDAAAAGLSGFIGGMGLSAIHAPMGAALGSLQANRYAAAQEKSLKQFVADYNTRYAETPVTYEQAKQSQGYQNRRIVGTLNAQLQTFMAEDLRLANELRSLSPTAGMAGPQGPMIGVNPRIIEILGERESIRGQIGATMLDVVGVSEGSIAAVREINGLPDETKVVMDAAVRAVSQTPLTPAQEQILLANGAYVRGSRIILPDSMLVELEKSAPVTAGMFFKQQEAEQLAEAMAAESDQSVVPQSQPAAQSQPQPPPLPLPSTQPVAQAPVAQQTQQQAPPPTPAPVQGGGSYTFTATYTPRGSQQPVTVKQTVQAATPEEAQTKAQTWSETIERRLSQGPVEIGEVEYSGGDTSQAKQPAQPQPAPPQPAAVNPAVFEAKPTAKSVAAMVEAAAPVLFNNPALPNVVMTPRLYVTRRMSAPLTAEEYKALPPDQRKQYMAMPSGGMAAYAGSSSRGPTIFVDQGALAVVLGSIRPADRAARIAAIAREEVLHIATGAVRGPEELAADWARLPDAVKRRVVEAYYPAQVLADANQDWRSVATDPQQMALEFWRMYLSAKLDGVTTEQVAFAQDVDRLAEADPVFASNLRQLLENLAQWLRDNLLGSLDDQTRADFEDVAAKIEAELARLDARGGAPAPVVNATETAAEEAVAPDNRAFVPAADTQTWTSEGLRAAVQSAAAAFGYKIVDTGIDVGAVDRYGNVVNVGTQMYDKFTPGSEVGQWIDKVGNSEFAAEIAEKMATPGLHRVWFGHDFLTNMDNVVGQFGWSAVPDFILQLLKDSLTKSGIPFPGVELLVRDGTVSDRFATDWLSTNIGEVFGGGVAFFGTYRLAQAARQGNLSRPRVVFATVGVGIKLAAGVATAQPFLIISGLADAAILVTNLDAVKAAFKKGADMAKERPARPVVRPPQMVEVRQVAPPPGPPAMAPPVEAAADTPSVVAPEPVVETPVEAVEAPQPAVAERIDAQERIRDGNKLRRVVQGRESDAELPALADDLQRRGLIEDYLGLWWPTEAGLSLLEANEVTAARREREMASLPVGSKVVVPNYRSDSMADGTILITGEPKIDLAAGRQRSERGIVYPALSGSMRTFGIRADEISEVREVGSVAERIAQPVVVESIDQAKANIRSTMVRFASGMSSLRDLTRGSYARARNANYGIGFDVGLLSKNAIDRLADSVVNLKTRVFVDSGAFSHFKKSAKTGGQLAPLDFEKILAKYDAILDAISKANPVEDAYPKPMFVMPDVIGDQDASLELIEKHKDWIATQLAMGASQPIIPIPVGQMTLSKAYDRIIEILESNTLGLEIDVEQITVGIPSNAKAVSLGKLAGFLEKSKPARIHFLGAAADKNLDPLLQIVARHSPQTEVTADASKVRSAILGGVSKGKTRDQAIMDALYQEDDPQVVLDLWAGEKPQPAPPRKRATKPKAATPAPRPASELDAAFADLERFLKPAEVRGPDGLTDTERAALEEELRADQESEAAMAVRDGGIDILEAVREAGGLPAKSSSKVYQYAGELQRIREAQRPGNAVGLKGAFNLFRTGAQDLDGLIKDLQTMGFRDLTTPSELFDLIERRLATGRPIYGYEGMVLAAAAQPAGSEFIAAMTRVADALYAEGATTPEAMAARLVERFGNDMTPKLLSQVWANGTNTDPDIQASWSEIYRGAVDENAATDYSKGGERNDRQQSAGAGGEAAALQTDAGQAGAEPADIQPGAGSGGLEDGRSAAGSARDNERVLNKLTLDQQGREARIAEAFGDDWPDGFDALGVPNLPKGITDPADPRLQETSEKTTATIVAGSLANRVLGIPAGEISRPILRETIIEYFMRGGNDRKALSDIQEPQTQDNPLAVFMGGGGAAGKTSLLNREIAKGNIPDEGRVLSNPDEIREFLPEYDLLNSLNDARSSVITHEEASIIADEIQRRARQNSFPMVIDGTMKNSEKALAKAEMLNEEGYRTKMIGVTIDPYEALIRSFLRGKGNQRYVPPDVLLGAHKGFNAALPAYIEFFGDDLVIYDNSPQNPILLSAEDILSGRFSEVGARADLNVNAATPEELLGSYGEADRIERPEANPQRVAAEGILPLLEEGRKLNFEKDIQPIADAAWGGSLAAGTYEIKDAYDAMELAVNLFLARGGVFDAGQGWKSFGPVGAIRALEDLQQRLPTQTKRSGRTDRYQQFSTPPVFSFVAHWVSGATAADVVLEPSAGIGGLAVYPKLDGATIIANELEPKRIDFLREMGFDHLTTENAEQIDAILEPQFASGSLPRPTVVNMNPPFSNAAKSGKTGQTMVGAKHVESALKALRPGGRLVAIVGEGMGLDTPTFRQWWQNMAKQYHVRANIWVDGRNYTKYGTSFSNRLLVIDKVAPPAGSTNKNIIQGQVDDLADLITLLQGVRNDRPNIQPSAEQAGAGDAQTLEPARVTRPDAGARTGTGGRAGRDGGRTGRTGVRPSETARPADSAGRVERGVSDGGLAGRGQLGGRGADDTQRTDGQRTGDGQPVIQGSGPESVEQTGITVEGAQSDARDIQNEDDVFATYKPAKVRIPGAQKHLAPLVESAAMASVSPPDPTYTPNLAKEVITEGRISETSLENIVYAGQAHSQVLPSGERRGYFIGDGTGVGKGRQIAGIIMDNLRQGRKKAVWISKSGGLIEDAKRDVQDVGLDPKKVFMLNKVKKGKKVEAADGILFTTYDTLKGGHQTLIEGAQGWWDKIKEHNSRMKQIAEWLGKDFDGVIALDEAHKAGNAIAVKGNRGLKQPSQAGVAVVDLQKLLPNARVVYVSATGATEVENLSYADRLGIWGEGTPFPNKQNFFDKIRAGGVSAMEVVARDLKAQGLYLARSISYKGVEFARLTHNLTPEQENLYNRIATAWQAVLSNMDRIMDETGAVNSRRARSNAASAFWGAQQRFFNQLLTGLQLPALLGDMDQQLAGGNSAVLQLVNTGEAVEKRALAKARTEAEGDEIPMEDLDLSPRQILLDFLEKSFPTDLYEEVQDPDNPERTVWQKVLNSEGQPVQSPAAVAEKERLMDEVALIDMPESPLNQIINRFGPDSVAEVTGRTQRVVTTRKNGKTETKIEKRGKAQARAEAQDFQDGKRRILIFSDAGGTGFSFHASNRAKNQQRRVHYLVQAGWRADNALQGFGRTHRTDQANAPIYRLLETNIKGHKRFIASIARRLAQLGALTTGERRTAGQGMFSDSDNLESSYSADALWRLMNDLYNERVEGFTFDEFSESLGYVTTREGRKVNKLVSQQGGLSDDQRPPITQFLNRILALPLDRQNQLFDLFMERLERRIEMAKDDGSYDLGTQNYRAERVEVVSDDVVFTQPETGATTRLVEIEAFEDQVFTTFEEAERGGAIMWVKNRRSGNVFALREGPPRTLDNGSVVPQWRRVGIVGNSMVQKADVTLQPGRMQGGKLVDAGNYQEVTRDEAATIWDSQIANAPKETKRKDHFLIGVMLPVWDRLGLERTRIFRFTPTTGEPMLGVQVPAKDVPGLRMRMGARNTMTAEQAFEMVLSDGAKLNLANGWLIERRRVSRELRVEISGLNYDQGRTYADQFGGIMERIEYKPRFFITDSEVMQRVMDRSPVTQINGENVASEEGAAPVVAGASRLVTPEDMDADMNEQAEWLVDQAARRGYESVDEFAAADLEAFQGLSAFWRETHPRAVGSAAQGGSNRGETEAEARVDALVNDNLGLATALAQRFNIARVDLEDKIQEARVGLLTAAQSFDESRGVPFGAYATRVIRNRLSNLFNAQKRVAGAEVQELDAPVGEMDGETGQSMLADRFKNDPADDDLAAVGEIMDSLPARPRRVWAGFMAGKTLAAIGQEEGISKQAVNKIMQATQNTLRAELAKRNIRSVDDVFAQKDPFDTGRIEGVRQEVEDEEAKVAAARPSVEAELAQIADERQKAQDYRKASEQTSNSPLLPGAKEWYNTWLRGRMDKLEFYAPGAKAAMLDNRRNEALVAATINSMMQQIRDDITRAFGYPAFWNKNKKRLQNFLDELLPVAARLEVDRIDENGEFVFKPFLMRTGTINAAKVRANKFKVGDMVATDRGTFEIGPEIDGGRYLLLKSMPAEVQQQIYQDFHTRYPEASHYLDRWIMPGMQEARYMGPQGTMTAEFNRYALRDLFNEWPQELKDLFGGIPMPDVAYVEGYTPDVAEAKTLGAMIGSLLRTFRSGARKMKAGEARETGNIKNLFEGFSIRTMEAHREKIRVLTRQRLIEAAAVDANRIPKDQASSYVELDQTYRKLLEAVKIARRLNPKAFPALTGALSPQDQKAMAKILGDAFRLRGRGLMIHKEVERELMLGVARQVSNNALTKLFSGLLERYNAGLLATPFTAIVNWSSSEITKVVRLANRLNYTVISIAAGDVNAAKLGAYEAMYLFRGFITDRFPQWQKNRIGKVVPREMFDDQTGLEAMDIDPNISVKQQLGRVNLGGAFMQAIGYGEIDVRQKQQMAYASYRAHAQIAWNEANRRGEVSNDTKRQKWQQNWIANAPAEIHRDVYLTTVLYLMDYQNVPAFLDPQQSMTATGQIVKRALLPFAKWPYNMARQFKRLTFDAALDTVMAGRTKQQRIEGMANLMTMAGIAAVGAAISMADDDEDDPILGASVDEEGNLLDAAFRTKNRLNLSRIARIVFAHGLMRDTDFTLDDGSGDSKDLWWRYRNYPYLKEGIAMGLLVSGKTDKALEQFGDISEEYVSLGMLAKVIGLSSFDKNKPVGFRLGEVAYDVGTAGLVPPPWRQFATRMLDPVMRRTRAAEPLGYGATMMDAFRANTPILSRTVPTTGALDRSAYAPFSAEGWFNKERKSVERSNMPADEKRATISSLRQQANKLNMTPVQQAEFMRLAGLPIEQFNLRGTSTVPAVANLERLRSMGIGRESYALVNTTDKLGRKSTQLVAPNASAIGYQPQGLQALRFFGGVNLMAVPRGRRELAK